MSKYFSYYIGIFIYITSATNSFANPIDFSSVTSVVQKEAQRLNAKIGVAIWDGDLKNTWQVNGNEHFPLNSTHKAFACANLLHLVDEKKLSLSELIHIKENELEPHSPVTKKYNPPIAMTLSQACQASLQYSDNTAANMILNAIGGPTKLTAFFRRMGDPVSRLDRTEPTLNEGVPGDRRDTTTPIAAARDLYQLLIKNELSPKSKGLLTSWMRSDMMANNLLRSVFPTAWKIADKTGAGSYGSRGIVAVIWPDGRPPLAIAIYVYQTNANMSQSDIAIARIGEAIKNAITASE